ncbi:sigma-54 dependent transcriptional regulator [Geobacter sp. DSM 9736]|uniref:sigma-54-dependent transcriptional regulator n=1 Tax=Geobacter sp. DSM 9736 TaxID=1277350 RepID=UPI000B50E4B5|nr:sigma-54 dependent transcriptional regulator [Geobacter sp. DSM 9736]SNB48084.1 two-component system, NtrC family, response regulator [Geobacter sp. DSM 9736]
MARILIIDDDEEICSSFSFVVKRMGHEALCANTLKKGLELSRYEPFDVIFLDVRMPDGNGLEALPQLKGTPSAPEIIIITGFGDAHGAELAIKSGAWDYIEKGSSLKEISLPLSRALQYREQKQAESTNVVVLRREEIIGSSTRLTECLELVAQASGSEANVLIMGETGSGKELFARALHRNSSRERGPFVTVDCAALPENLIESLLFGHEKGAFTGADQAKEGLIRQADGGTLFLDEVGELPMSLQKAFLRVLQEHRFRPVGSSREVSSDFRLVAATNRNLEKMVENGQFRGDLLFRLQAFVIELPPLRERREDIRELTRYHVDRFCEHYSLSAKGFSPEFLETLCSYPWPGNVRELVNTLERTVILARFEPILFPQHLPPYIRIQVTQASLVHEIHIDEDTGVNYLVSLPKLHDYRETVFSQAEKQYLHNLMSLADENMGEACRISGLSQSRLYALLKKHQISS